MKPAGNSSSPIAARKNGAAKRDRRHVRAAVAMYVQPHVKANSAARGEVLELLGQAVQNAAIPASPATRNTIASRVVPNVFTSIPILLSRRFTGNGSRGRTSSPLLLAQEVHGVKL